MEDHGNSYGPNGHGITGSASFDVREIIGNQRISNEEVHRLAVLLLGQMCKLSGWTPNPRMRPNEIHPIHWS